jgi:uncharacterized protein YecE (DUF72 family)
MRGQLYLGSMGWSYNFWPLYGEESKPDNYLSIYSENFNSVEINNTFYRIPSQTMVKHWFNEVPKSFVFSAKFPRSISHAFGLDYDEERLHVFLGNLSVLGKKKGPVVLQLPPFSGLDDHDNLRALLEALPEDNLYAVEFRNRKWFKESTYELLETHNVAMVLQEHPTLPESTELTTKFVYIRCEGDRKRVNGKKGVTEANRLEDTEKWAKRVNKYLEDELDVYCYFSKYYSGYPPDDIAQMKKFLSQLSE